MERLFNCIPGHIRDITESSTEYFKKQLDEWLEGIPDQPKCGVYAGRCAGANNSIAAQYWREVAQVVGGEPLVRLARCQRPPSTANQTKHTSP